MRTTNTCGIVVVRIVTGRAIGTSALAIRTHLPYTTRCADFVGGHELTRIAFRTERRTVLRSFVVVTWYTLFLFRLVGVVAYRAFFTHQLCFFVFVHARIAVQTIDSTVLVHVLASTAFYT